MNILLTGYNGFMGREVAKLAEEGYRGATVTAGVDIKPTGTESVAVYTSFDEIPVSDGIDCIIDFSYHTAIGAILDYAVSNNIPSVICTTGHTDEEKALINDASKRIPVFFSANMSLGVALLVELAKKAALAMPEANIEIVEKHHNRKLDAPSGTALMIASAICETNPSLYTNCGRNGHAKRSSDEIGIHAIRMGNIVGEHEVIIGTNNQTITLKHEAHSRALFAEGAISAAEFLITCPPGMYDMKSLLGGDKKDPVLSGT